MAPTSRGPYLSSSYLSQDDVQGMLDALTPLHAALELGPQTTSEASFQLAFGAELLEAHGRCQAYVATQSRTELSAAWDIYYHVFRRISKQIAKLAVLELTHASTQLFVEQGRQMYARVRQRLFLYAL